MSEFSEENLAFYLACEEYRDTKESKLSVKAKKIYDKFICCDAPKEVRKHQRMDTKLCVALMTGTNGSSATDRTKADLLS